MQAADTVSVNLVNLNGVLEENKKKDIGAKVDNNPHNRENPHRGSPESIRRSSKHAEARKFAEKVKYQPGENGEKYKHYQ